MTTYRAVQVTGTRDFRLVDRELVEPAPNQVRVRVEYCGVCHTDVLAAEGLRADPGQPVVPGHEIVGVIDAVGAGVGAWRVGERVGIGFLAGHCGECDPCRRGDFVNCRYQEQTGTTVDGGYAEVVYARTSGLVRVPDEVPPAEAAPLLCAGLTTFTGLQRIGARPGALVAVQGIGGLGHLALQYARSLGYRVVAIARGREKEALARELGAHHYVDSTEGNVADALQALGGAAAILATAASGAAMNPLVAGLAPRGRLVVLGAAPDPIEVGTADLLFGTRTIQGHLTGTPIENEDNLSFSAAHGITPRIELFPLSEAPKAYARMLSGGARFRAVLDARG
ncbi:alcohol dehydrogenase catalytic domain-containing protein [Kitasatospora sp. YST-16]|uniref:alcohol dehydrogenase catalytic domain-containing protein n=1 Tax=Kitasatospora sp. YST-16 TaxID=2998080 RepID=UPI002284B3F6|nr:alcohol dehydrogenase catalytic domain-containing protein [Kitasatospora sp. YST-16]WAL75967.1 alcohol dehydrogenase catalytic domain-containing protein [Kitasatospora sp. YST-16]WNW42028.1 alcohol dehydrogenase catalytic domain-containing protein [Streptomyces sp. Li-HN-5-13]